MAQPLSEEILAVGTGKRGIILIGNMITGSLLIHLGMAPHPCTSTSNNYTCWDVRKLIILKKNGKRVILEVSRKNGIELKHQVWQQPSSPAEPCL